MAMDSVTPEQFRVLEARVNRIEEMRLDEHDQQIGQILRLAAKHETDIAELREQMERRFEQMYREFEKLRHDLPGIIATSVAPLLRK